MIVFKLNDSDITVFSVDDDAQFATDIINYDGEEIYELVMRTNGCYDITFGDGHIIYSVSTDNIEIS